MSSPSAPPSADVYGKVKEVERIFWSFGQLALKKLNLLQKILCASLLASILIIPSIPALFSYSVPVNAVPKNEPLQPASLIIAQSSLDPTCSTSALCPNMIDQAYGFESLHLGGTMGKGQTVVIVDACGDPDIASDLSTFDSQFDLPKANLTVIYPQGSAKVCSNSDWSIETSLDVEIVHVVAPSAAIDLLVAANPSALDVYQAWTFALTNNLGSQISNSFGGAGCYARCNNTIGQGIGPCDLTNGTQGFNVNKLLSEAKSEKVTVLASAGDSGAWGQGTSNGEPIPGDCQGVLTVGGTTLHVYNNGTYINESAWNDGGGGYVSSPAEPNYQKTAEISDPFDSLAKPDVAAVADPATAPWIYNKGEGRWFIVGGTSVACPLWAGFLALVNQIRQSEGLEPAGYINSFLYNKVYGLNGTSPLYQTDFHDITTGNNGWAAGTGWDPATGLGSFAAPALANTLGTSPAA